MTHFSKPRIQSWTFNCIEMGYFKYFIARERLTDCMKTTLCYNNKYFDAQNKIYFCCTVISMELGNVSLFRKYYLCDQTWRNDDIRGLGTAVWFLVLFLEIASFIIVCHVQLLGMTYKMSAHILNTILYHTLSHSHRRKDSSRRSILLTRP